VLRSSGVNKHHQVVVVALFAVRQSSDTPSVIAIPSSEMISRANTSEIEPPPYRRWYGSAIEEAVMRASSSTRRPGPMCHDAQSVFQHVSLSRVHVRCLLQGSAGCESVRVEEPKFPWPRKRSALEAEDQISIVSSAPHPANFTFCPDSAYDKK